MRKCSLSITKLGLLLIIILLMGTIISVKAEAQSSWNQGWLFSPFTMSSLFRPYYFGQINYQNWGQYQTWPYPISNPSFIQTTSNNWALPSYPGLSYFPQFETNWWPQSSSLNYNWQGDNELSSSINSGRTASWWEPFGYQRDISLYENLDFSRPAIGHGYGYLINPEIYDSEPDVVPSNTPVSIR